MSHLDLDLAHDRPVLDLALLLVHGVAGLTHDVLLLPLLVRLLALLHVLQPAVDLLLVLDRRHLLGLVLADLTAVQVGAAPDLGLVVTVIDAVVVAVLDGVVSLGK